MYRVINSLLLFLLAALPAIGQDLDADLRKIVQHIDSADGLSIETSVKVYARKGGSVIYAANASVHRNAAASLTKLGDQEYYTGKQYDVTVDHEERSVLILKKETPKAKKKKETLEFDASALLELLGDGEKEPKRTVTLVSDQNGKKTYSVSGVPGMKEVRMTLDMHALAIRQVIYEFSEQSENKGQYVTIAYTTFGTDPEVGNLLKTSQYFSESDGRYVLSARLKNYKLYTEL